MNGDEKYSYRFKSFHLNLAERQLLQNDEPISLTPKAFDVLVYLVERSGHLVEKEELIQAVWPDSFVEEANLARIVHTLRKVLDENENGSKYIETVPKKGYRFVADVIKEEKDPSFLQNLPLEQFPIQSWDTSDSPDDPAVRHRSSKNSIKLAVIAVGLVFAISGTYIFVSRQFQHSPESRRSIAVMPFTNATKDDSLDYLVDGITENILNNLSSLSGLKVTGLNSVFPYKGKEIHPQEIAKELGVDALVMGDIKQVDTQLIINVTLVDAKDGSQLWGKQFIKNSFDVVATPNEISQAVARSLSVSLTDAEKRHLATIPTENPEAYQLYLRGQSLGQQITPDGLFKSIELYSQAIEKDPKFALAYSEIGMRYVLLGIYFMPPNESMPKARAAAEKALEIDDTLNDPHVVLGLVALLYDWNWNRSQDELTEGTSINLRSIEVFNCTAHVLQMAGKTLNADEALRRALQKDPLSIHLITELGCNSYYARRFDESIAEYRNSLAIDPHNFMAVYGLARSLNQTNKFQEAIEELDKAKEFMPMVPPIAVAEKAFANAKMGKREETEAGLKTLDEQSKKFYVDPFFYATVYLGKEDKEQALVWLEKAYIAKSSLMPTLANDKKWDVMRNEPRFQDLLRRTGAPA